MGDLENILIKQKEFYKSKKTLDVDFRIDKLKKLKIVLKNNENKILEALKKDLNKCYFEGYSTELGIVYEEINIMIKGLRKWSKRERKKYMR